LGRIDRSVRPSFVSAVLVVAVLGVSLSGPLVRISNAHPIAIAIWRLIFSLAVIAVPFPRAASHGGRGVSWTCAFGLAALLPGIREQPSIYTLVGGALVLGGILLAERQRRA
jgi:hypothetical protein